MSLRRGADRRHVDALYGLAAAWTHFLDAGPDVPGFCVCMVLAGVPVTLVHELGHALMARRTVGGNVLVLVGTAGKLASVRLGRITMNINAFARPGGVAGLAAFDGSRATARDVVLISLAGPAASFAGFVVSAMAYAAAPATGALHSLLWTLTFAGLCTSLFNLVPLKLQNRRGAPAIRTDGRLALDAARIARRLPAARMPVEPSTSVEVPDDGLARRARMLARNAGRSVPPPGA